MQSCCFETLEDRRLCSASLIGGGDDEDNDRTLRASNNFSSAPSVILRTNTRIVSLRQTQVFELRILDNLSINMTTLDNRDVRIVGPNGFSSFARLDSFRSPGDGSFTIARYKMGAPGGSWDERENGTYRVLLRADGVSDVDGNFAAAQELGRFRVSVRDGGGATLQGSS